MVYMYVEFRQKKKLCRKHSHLVFVITLKGRHKNIMEWTTLQTESDTYGVNKQLIELSKLKNNLWL